MIFTEAVAKEPGQFVLLVGLVANILMQLWRERRNRRWQLEDAERSKRELAEHEKAMKAALASQTDDIQKAMRTRVTDFSGRLNHLLDEHNKNRRSDDAG
jgi:DNA-binding GntR family transcriptional regulator